jgi:uncharacterized protein YyaL (SSP411 family)
LDADSEGEEGKYYVWRKEELKAALNEDYELFAAYYNVNERGFWEHENYILLRNESDEIIASSKKLSIDELKSRMEKSRKYFCKFVKKEYALD